MWGEVTQYAMNGEPREVSEEEATVGSLYSEK